MSNSNSNTKEVIEALRDALAKIQDTIISDNPFQCSNSEGDIQKRSNLFQLITDKLSSYQYVSKKKSVIKLLVFGVGIPLGILGILFGLDYIFSLPVDDVLRMYILGGLILIALGFGVAAAVVGHIPSLDESISLALYTAPRGWSFAMEDSEEVWEKYTTRFSYFDKGDENQYIGPRIWGYLNDEKKRPFQMFHFHYEDVVRTGKTTTYIPYDYYGIFLSLPESRCRFRITEDSDNDGLKKSIKLEYNKFNKAVTVYCDSADEILVRQFLSPAVQEVIMQLSNDLPDMLIDFSPGFSLLVTSQNFFSKISGLRLDENTPNFQEIVWPGIECIELFRKYAESEFNLIKKYNDNY